MPKTYLGTDVLTAAKDRISWTFDKFERIYISFSGGKDSTTMTHLVMDEAIKRNRKVAVLFIDWECQFELTIKHIREIIKQYKDNLEVFWIQLEILTNNATSMIEPIWKSWDEDKKELWTRDKELEGTVTDGKRLPFYFDTGSTSFRLSTAIGKFVPSPGNPTFSPGSLTLAAIH